MKHLILSALLFSTASAFAGDWSAPAVPTRIEHVPGTGIIVLGNFGNPSGCAMANSLVIPSNHPEYKMLYATAMSALLGKQKLYGYADKCTAVPWLSLPETTYNLMTSGSLSIVSQ